MSKDCQYQSKRESVFLEVKTSTCLHFKISLRIFNMTKVTNCTTLLKLDSLKNLFQKIITSERPIMAQIYIYLILCSTLNFGKNFPLKIRESMTN
jgi:hypothetical protein